MSEESEAAVKIVDRRRWKADGEANADASAPVSQKPSYVEELETKLAAAEKQAQEYLGKYREASHEFDDARARMRKELAKDAERSRREVLVSLLEVVDNLDRAIGAALRVRSGQASGASENVGDPLLQGVEMVQQQFLAKLDGFGVRRIDALGQPFDPALHEAVTTVSTQDPAADGRIVGVIAHGYRIGDEVLRAALVAVGQHS